VLARRRSPSDRTQSPHTWRAGHIREETLASVSSGVIDDPDIERAVERLERELGELRSSVTGVHGGLARVEALVEALLQEAQRTYELLERLHSPPTG
jgi:prefoldin subunit 5